MKFEELAQVALLGTERQNCSTSTALTPLGQLESQIDLAQRARALLSLAALCGLHEQVGRLPTTDRSPMPEPCPPETVTVCGDRAAVLLSRLLTCEFEVLLPEWLALAASARVVASRSFAACLIASQIREMSAIGSSGFVGDSKTYFAPSTCGSALRIATASGESCLVDGPVLESESRRRFRLRSTSDHSSSRISDFLAPVSMRSRIAAIAIGFALRACPRAMFFFPGFGGGACFAVSGLNFL